MAFSGGVDSTFLLKAAVDMLGAENVLACIGISPSLAQHQLTQAREMAKLIGVELAEIPLDELDDPNYQVNKADRCFHCKSCQFRTIQEYAKERGIEHTLCGSNFDDKDDYRPGNVLIIQERDDCDFQAGFCATPDDEGSLRPGEYFGEFEFVFSQDIILDSIDFFDVEFNENNRNLQTNADEYREWHRKTFQTGFLPCHPQKPLVHPQFLF